MIWCVEDDASIRDIELYALTSTGFEARGFDDGASFWEALQTETPEPVSYTHLDVYKRQSMCRPSTRATPLRRSSARSPTLTP